MQYICNANHLKDIRDPEEEIENSKNYNIRYTMMENVNTKVLIQYCAKKRNIFIRMRDQYQSSTILVYFPVSTFYPGTTNK